MKDQDFINLLQAQASQQSRLNRERILPSQMDVITSFVGNYPWQVILGLSLVGAGIWQFFGG